MNNNRNTICLTVHSGTIPSAESAQCLGSADIPLTSANVQVTEIAADTARLRPGDVVAVTYVGASDQLQIEERRCTTIT